MAWHHEKEKDKSIDTKGNTASADIHLLIKLKTSFPGYLTPSQRAQQQPRPEKEQQQAPR